jgi:hypothetical protein
VPRLHSIHHPNAYKYPLSPPFSLILFLPSSSSSILERSTTTLLLYFPYLTFLPTSCHIKTNTHVWHWALHLTTDRYVRFFSSSTLGCISLVAPSSLNASRKHPKLLSICAPGLCVCLQMPRPWMLSPRLSLGTLVSTSKLSLDIQFGSLLDPRSKSNITRYPVRPGLVIRCS